MNDFDVFLIDDSEVDSFVTKNELNQIEFIKKITHFDSPQMALQFILDDENAASLPQLLLLDISMPVIDGFEFINELEESEKFADDYPFQIILLTNSRNARDREKFEREHSVIKFVEKPIASQNFKTILEDLFKG